MVIEYFTETRMPVLCLHSVMTIQTERAAACNNLEFANWRNRFTYVTISCTRQGRATAENERKVYRPTMYAERR
jgi:hypothetical protein